MTVTPIRPDKAVAAETKSLLKERDATFEKDRKTSVDARRAILNVRRKLEKLEPR